MFARLFGETEQDQFQYLRVRSVATLICLVAPFVLAILSLILPVETLMTGVSVALGILFLFFWGWPALKALTGIATIGALFSRNIMVAMLILFVLVLVSYALGVLFALLGTGRFIYLVLKMRRENQLGSIPDSAETNG